MRKKMLHHVARYRSFHEWFEAVCFISWLKTMFLPHIKLLECKKRGHLAQSILYIYILLMKVPNCARQWKWFCLSTIQCDPSPSVSIVRSYLFMYYWQQANVDIAGIISISFTMNATVPQGSVLSSILFLLHIDNL